MFYFTIQIHCIRQHIIDNFKSYHWNVRRAFCVQCTVMVSSKCALPDGNYVLGRCFIHESRDLAYARQLDLRIKALNKANTYLPFMKSVNYISCRLTYTYIQGVTQAKLVISITLQGKLFPRAFTHFCLNRDNVIYQSTKQTICIRNLLLNYK